LNVPEEGRLEAAVAPIKALLLVSDPVVGKMTFCDAY
jgi:hypothetical protein